MERSKLIISVAVGVAALFIIWRVGFYPPVPEPAEKPAETVAVTEPNKPSEVPKLADVNEPKVVSDVNRPGGLADVNQPKKVADVNEPTKLAKAAEVEKPVEPNEPMEAINLKNVEMRNIIQKIADWTGKTVIPDDEAMKQKITIYAPKKLPRSKALAKIYSALLMKGYVAEDMDDTIYLKPLAEAKLGLVPTIPIDQPLAAIENKDQIVQRFFPLKNYSASQMGQVIQPLVGEHGHVSADETTSSILVIDTVANLMRIERIIQELDVSQTEKTVTEIFEIHHGDPEEIVELLQTLLGDGSTSSSSRDPRRGFRPPWERGGPRPTPVSSSSSSSKTGKGAATSVTVGTSTAPMVLIAQPRYNWIIAKASPEDMEQIRQWIRRLDKPVATVTSDIPLTRIQNKNQVMQYFFKLENYSPAQMAQVVEPLLTEDGYVSADENTGQLLVIDTVDSLITIERIIKQFDVPEAEQTAWDIFEIRYGDPSEIVQLLRMLLGDGTAGSSRSYRSSRYGYSSSYGRSSRYSSSRYSSSSRYGGYGSSSYRGSSRGGAGTSVLIGPSQLPVILIPEPKRKWIIARASAEDIKMIGEWIEKLDRKEPAEKEYETMQITYADVREVADRVNEAFQQMPGSELQASVLVQPLEQARQIVIFGREDLRQLVKKLVQEIDIPSGLLQTEQFKLKYADPDEIKEKIEELYAATSTTGSRFTNIYYFGGSRATRGVSADTVKVISYTTLKQVTVIASAENMEKIRQQIAEWDVPIDVNELKPRIIELRNSDPVQMADLLSTLFSEEGGEGISVRELLFGITQEKGKIVGPLYGQLTFEEVPGTKKIIVISKIPEAYDVVEALIHDLDKQEMAEVPRVVQLKYADPEDLAERLNAMFNEPGTSARIRVSAQGLGDYSMEEETQSNQQQGGGGGGTTGGDQSSEGTYTPWWSQSGARSRIDEEMPISNVIGRIRFVPDPHSKSILVLAPGEFIDQIEELIQQLDIPGKQVMIKAVIVEVDHKSMTSLGLQLASDTTAFGTLAENAITARNVLELLEKHGALVFGAGGDQGSAISLDVDMDVTALVDFLIKKVNAKILNQQTLWTKDNEEASFFKGEKIAFQTQMGVTQQTTTQSFEFQRVGMTLAARPSITPEKNVDMVINVILSQLTGDLVNNQPARTEMETETNMIVQDGQTIMLGGILFQKDSRIRRKIPLLGDIPLAGNLFRHNEMQLTNNELIVFITPYVIDEPGEMLPETQAEIEGPQRKLESVREELDATMQRLEQELP